MIPDDKASLEFSKKPAVVTDDYKTVNASYSENWKLKIITTSSTTKKMI
jgi:hypothetical protein